MKKISMTVLVLACLGLTGCASQFADVPAPTRFNNVEQQSIKAAAHWQTIASHFADQLSRDISAKLSGRMIYIPQPGGEQAFVEGFRDLLITALVNRGVPVSLNERGAVLADVRYAAYRFNPDRAANTRYSGETTALMAGLWAIGGVMAANISSVPAVDGGVKLLAAAASLEGFDWLKNEHFGMGRFDSGNVPQSEIVLTVSLLDEGRIVGRQSNIYYTANKDEALYWNRRAAHRAGVIKIHGDCGAGGLKCER
ncbi:MAG: hypothetical protein U1D25_00850 [Hydrogenophaga sp.]|uniref:hypothetical protein n=1 Tax=Hydrogenophaga sp. TaxID=1904254 RepID=UPI002755CE71|nr:hypothetical protein [Hydrogenophaga sp.]MDP2416234.1 hypothetical protein [Hydrogenophaga sp.]MDZ4186641.1 hypothetical protein [Hydrogenophaga sp.]